MIDRPVDVRPGEALDVTRLGPYLRDTLNLEGEVEVLQYPSGFSNLTYMLRVGDTELVLRRPPFGSKPKSGHDMKREHDVLAALHGSFPYCPKPLAYCERRGDYRQPLLRHGTDRGHHRQTRLSARDVALTRRRQSPLRTVVDVHVELHSVDYRAVGLEDFGKPEGYVERQVAGWSDRYRRARTPDVPDCEGIMAWLEENRPPDSGPGCIIHNDFRLDNLVLDPADPMRIVGVLDWEMATLGDPLMDLGASLAYWVEQGDPRGFQAMRMMPTNADGAPTRAEVVARYAAKSGLEVRDFSFYYCYGLFRFGRDRAADLLPLLPRPDRGPALPQSESLGRRPRRCGAGGGREVPNE